jgi:hypothetical protein
MSEQLPEVVPDREPLTEGEALRIGQAASRLARFRNLLKAAQTPKSGFLGVGGSGFFGDQPLTVNLGSRDIEAVLSLLIEREVAFLASFNVKIEETT